MTLNFNKAKPTQKERARQSGDVFRALNKPLPFHERGMNFGDIVYGEGWRGNTHERVAVFLADAIMLARAHGVTTDQMTELVQYTEKLPELSKHSATGDAYLTLTQLARSQGIGEYGAAEERMKRFYDPDNRARASMRAIACAVNMQGDK